MIDDGYEPANDYEDQMDGLALGLFREADLYCKHGTFIGNWAGPDYMCGPCEMGVSDEEWEAGNRRAERRARRVAALRPKLDELIVRVNVAAEADPNSDETKRLITRLVRYMGWRVRPAQVIASMVREIQR